MKQRWHKRLLTRQLMYSRHLSILKLTNVSLSESAARVKLFFPLFHCINPLLRMHYERPERKTGLCKGCNLSADSGAKTRLGLGETLSPSGELYSTGIGIKAINPRGLGSASERT